MCDFLPLRAANAMPSYIPYFWKIYIYHTHEPKTKFAFELETQKLYSQSQKP